MQRSLAARALRLAGAAVSVCACLALPAPAKAGWHQVQSEHFTYYTQGSLDEASDRLRALEVFHWMALKLLGADGRSLSLQTRFDVLQLPSYMTLGSIRPDLGNEVLSASFMSCSEGNLIASVATIPRQPVQDEDLIVWEQFGQQIAVAGNLMLQYGPGNYPGWYLAGFPSYLSTTRLDGVTLVMGDRNRLLGHHLDRGPWLPTRELLTWDSRSREKSTSDDTSNFSAQSWLLTHYMLDDSSRADGLKRYLARVVAGEDALQAFEPATGIALADLDLRLRAHWNLLPQMRLRMTDLPRAAIQAVPLSDDAAAVLIDNLALRVCPEAESLPRIRKRLGERAARNYAGADTRRALARAYLLSGQHAQAVALLQPMLAGQADADAAPAEAAESAAKAETHYLMGRSLMLGAEDLQGEAKTAALEQARSHLFKAYRARKEDAPTLYHLAQVLAKTRGPADASALNAARAARLLAPRVEDYALLQARLDLQVGNAESAVRALAPHATNPQLSDRAMRMHQVILNIRAGKGLAALDAAKATSLQPEPEKNKP